MLPNRCDSGQHTGQLPTNEGQNVMSTKTHKAENIQIAKAIVAGELTMAQVEASDIGKADQAEIAALVEADTAGESVETSPHAALLRKASAKVTVEVAAKSKNLFVGFDFPGFNLGRSAWVNPHIVWRLLDDDNVREQAAAALERMDYDPESRGELKAKK